VLKDCVPGCESIERTGDNEYEVVLTAKVGPVSAKFKGKMTLANIQAPNSYSIAFEGQGGVAGFAKGGAEVSLTTEGHDTRLSYKAKANVGGKLAQIGSRLVDAAANKVANDFFVAFNEKVGKPRQADASHDKHDEHRPEPVAADPDLPRISDASLSFFAAGALVVFVVALLTLI
jgi:carbon monoxide dehydrogenase subunit G